MPRRLSGRYRARYRDLAGKGNARLFHRKADVRRWLDSVTTSVHTGTYVDPRRMRLTVGEWAPQWLATRVDLKATTRRGYLVALRSRILPTWGSAGAEPPDAVPRFDPRAAGVRGRAAGRAAAGSLVVVPLSRTGTRACSLI